MIRRNLAAHIDQMLKRRLHIPGFIDRAAHDHELFAMPIELCAERRERLAENWCLQHCWIPAIAAVRRHVHVCDLAVTTPGDPFHLVAALAGQTLCTGWIGDKRLALHHEGKRARGRPP